MYWHTPQVTEITEAAIMADPNTRVVLDGGEPHPGDHWYRGERDAEFDVQKFDYIVATACLTAGLKTALFELAQLRRGGGLWLDALETKFVIDAKNCNFVGVPEKFETSAVEFTVSILNALFAAVRGQINNMPEAG
jgi:hypothetical protein